MIEADQPTIFGEALTIGVSSAANGNMRYGRGDDRATTDSREQFLDEVGVDPLQATLVQVTYDDTTDFCRYRVIDDDAQGEGMLEPISQIEADGLVVTRPGHALFLPLADCAGVVLYDTVNQVLMVSHIGRHSVLQDGARRSVEYLNEVFETQPADLQVWVSPSVGGESYPLAERGGRSIRAVICEQLVVSGVPIDQLEASAIDTASSPDYFSHSAFLAGEQDTDGRFAIVAMMND